MANTMIAVVLILVLAVGFLVYQGGYLGQVGTTVPSDDGVGEIKCDSDTAVTLTFATPDLYGGSAVTTQNMFREVGRVTTTDVAGAATTTALNPGDRIDVLFGTDSNSGNNEPYGPVIKNWEVPCDTAPDIEQFVVDDASVTELSYLFEDPNDGNSIIGEIGSTYDEYDVDAGDTDTVYTKFTGAFEKDFGNRWCEEQKGRGNVLVIRYNTSAYDDIHPETLSGQRMSAANYQLTYLLSSSSGYTDAAYEVPVLKSNVPVDFNLIVDADDTINPDGGQSNITWYLYDVDYYIDNDHTPSEWKCGIMDEDGTDIGHSAAFNGTWAIEND